MGKNLLADGKPGLRHQADLQAFTFSLSRMGYAESVVSRESAKSPLCFPAEPADLQREGLPLSNVQSRDNL